MHVKILLLPIAPLYERGKPPLPSPASTCNLWIREQLDFHGP